MTLPEERHSLDRTEYKIGIVNEKALDWVVRSACLSREL